MLNLLMPKKLFTICTYEILRGGSDEKVFSFDFNMKAVYLIKRVCSL